MPASKRHTLAELIRDIGDEPALTAAEERDLGRIIRDPASSREDRERAINTLISRNLRLAIFVARKSFRRREDLGDLVNDGTIGLRRAAEKFDPELGIRFSTYAVRWIKAAIARFRIIEGRGQPWVIPTHLWQKRSRAQTVRRELAGRGIEVSVEEAGRRIGFGKHVRYFDRLDSVTFQENAPDEIHGSDGYADLRMAESYEAEAPDEQAETNELRLLVRKFLCRLNDQERMVIRYYYGFDLIPGTEAVQGLQATRPGGLIASHLDISGERVNQVRRKALTKIRQWAEEAGCS
jgi:RNA polymerase sigma factor (sigma-70 family)